MTVQRMFGGVAATNMMDTVSNVNAKKQNVHAFWVPSCGYHNEGGQP